MSKTGYADIYDDTQRKARLTNAKTFVKRQKNRIVLAGIVLYLLFQVSMWGSSTGSSKSLYVGNDNEAQQNLKLVGKDLYRQNAIDVKHASLRERMAYYFPYEPEKPLPHTIWQTWKCGENDASFPRRFREPQASWKAVNPEADVFLISDDHSDEFIKSTFAEVPEIVETYRLLPKNILKADFFRYLVIYARGGTYSDLDTVCLKPVQEWAPFTKEWVKASYGKTFATATNAHSTGKYALDSKKLITPVGLTIGIEADPNRPDWAEWYARRVQFCQWTIQGKRGHPLLREVIYRIIEETMRKQSMGRLKKVEGKDKGGDIMQWTGPGIFTDTVLDYLNNVVSDGKQGDGYGVGSSYWIENQKYNDKGPQVSKSGDPLNSEKQEVSWKTFSGLEEPMMVDDVMVLPITSFSPGVGQMGSKSIQNELAYVHHLFGGTWKKAEN